MGSHSSPTNIYADILGTVVDSGYIYSDSAHGVEGKELVEEITRECIERELDSVDIEKAVDYALAHVVWY